ncbi:23S rRNA (uracil(1939)-C(5))-methyltransferase RlmD [soil metagenome]
MALQPKSKDSTLEVTEETVHVTKLVHGGQGLGTLVDGRTVFVWNALPGETVTASVIKYKKNYAEAIAVDVQEPSTDRVTPRDDAYLSTSPWQILSFKAENTYKQAILTEAMERENVRYKSGVGWYAGNDEWHYRNKMEYSFFGDDDGLHMALFRRGTHTKQILDGSSIARPELDETARAITAVLDDSTIRASQLKSLVVRCNQASEVVASLFVKDEKLVVSSAIAETCKGGVVYYSTPKSPASVMTKKLVSFGDTTLSDTIAGRDIIYDVHSFFQVNLPVFERALDSIAKHAKGADRLVDMYAGVGTIGISVGATVFVEIDARNVAMAKQNIGDSGAEVVQASTETALDFITPEATILFDPPRAGLHAKIVDRILEATPKKIIYLSCNPSTQARDIARLQDTYTITSIEGFNFFPKTPHIESLAVLELR